MPRTPQQIVTTFEGWATGHLLAAAGIALVIGILIGGVIF